VPPVCSPLVLMGIVGLFEQVSKGQSLPRHVLTVSQLLMVPRLHFVSRPVSGIVETQTFSLWLSPVHRFLDSIGVVWDYEEAEESPFLIYHHSMHSLSSDILSVFSSSSTANCGICPSLNWKPCLLSLLSRF
jgi:hypothetical protein